MTLEFMINMWQNTIYPTFSEIIDYFTTPLSQELSKGLEDIPILGTFLTAIVEVFPQVTLIELILGSAIFITLGMTIIKWVIGLVT